MASRKSNSQWPNQAQSPRGSAGAPRAGRQQQQQKKIFEPYWPVERVSEGIKRGELIVGPVRINPKNYEDAYVPLPDGKADIYVRGMADRNRALNSDVVVLLPYQYDQWRVFVEDFEDYEKAQSSSSKKARGGSGVDGGQDVDGDSDDSGPDVIFESSSDDEADGGDDKGDGAGNKTAGSTGASGSSENAASELRVSAAMQKLRVNKESCAGSSESPKVKAAEPGSKGQQSPAPGSQSQKKKFTSVSDMRQQGSPLARDLFGARTAVAAAPDAGKPGQELKGNNFVQPTGKVVYIYERKHSRAASGHVRLMPGNRNLALFAPTDSRVPRIVISMADCPKDFLERSEDYARTLFIARIQQWDETAKMPKGTLARSLGEAGEIEPQTEALLIEMDVEDQPFTEEVLQCLPTDLPWSIPASEMSYRRDFRRECVFTIDPATARDLDDAVSIEDLGNGMFEVGVHIADVSFFVKEDTALDESAGSRATSVYLVQKVVPMLPRLLCEELCSLNPDEDRLAFTVLWKINEDGEIFDEWYGRSVIRSCVKLSYDHAQGFIDQPEKEWSRDELPAITNTFGVEDVKKRVLQLNKIAVSLRKQRFDNGALRLDQVKLQYVLDGESGLPKGYFVYEQRDSNRLIEEFMLLANMAVAHKIKSSFPELAILRRHPPPQTKPLAALEELCGSLDLKISTASAGQLHRSLMKYYGDDELAKARLQVLVNMVSKPMQHAKYFCAGCIADESLYHHYALNVPLYTHFTSPIRRYPDIMVHRLLAAALGYCPPPARIKELFQKQAELCNDKKQNAKMCSDRSSEMYFSIFVKEAGPLEEMGMVMGVLDKSFDVLILRLGVTKRVYLDKLPLMKSKFRKNKKCPELLIEWAADESCDHRTRHLITVFTVVDCYIYAENTPLMWSCVIRRPKAEIKRVSRE